MAFLALVLSALWLIGINAEKKVHLVRTGDLEARRTETIGDDCKSLVEELIPKLNIELRLRTSEWKVFSFTGVLRTTCSDVNDGDKLVLVPPGRLFMFPKHPEGTEIELSHVIGGDGKSPVVLKSLMRQDEGPRVFAVDNFMSKEDCDFLIENALAITKEGYELKRSTTGVQAASYPKRTSDNAFDVDSEVSMKLKRRSFEVLGIPEYDDRWSDGLQILRYNQSAAYISHMDFMPLDSKSTDEHNYDSREEDGSNRFATLVVYLTDAEDGGETVFPFASTPPPWIVDPSKPKDPLIVDHYHRTLQQVATFEEERQDTDEFIEERGLQDKFPKDGWERQMVASCQRSESLTIKALKAKAVLFYNQLPDGAEDEFSMHGGCPVLKGTKWAANLWVWNRPRQSHWVRDAGTGRMKVKGIERKVDILIRVAGLYADLELWWGPKFWGKLQEGVDYEIGTYERHEWSLRTKAEGHVIWQTVIRVNEEDPDARQNFIINEEVLHSLPPGGLAILKTKTEAGDKAAPPSTDSDTNSDRAKDTPAPPVSNAVSVAFSSTDLTGAHLFYDDNDFGEIPVGGVLTIHTFEGHSFRAELNGQIVKTWMVVKENKMYMLSRKDMSLESQSEDGEEMIDDLWQEENAEF